MLFTVQVFTNWFCQITGLDWAGIKTMSQTFGPMGVLARYRNICQLRQYLCTAKHLGRAKCKHIHDELWRLQANIVSTIFVDARQK
jgi:hypothetical protein